MTPPPLPDLLRRLAELMPSRVQMGHQFSGGTQYIFVWDDNWAKVNQLNSGWLSVLYIDPRLEKGYTLQSQGSSVILECLMQECGARNWNISMDVYAQDISRAWVLTPNRPLAYKAETPTPAHALVAAMVSALESEA